jgi:hypothetical protein
MELYLTVARVFGTRALQMELFETEFADVAQEHDYFSPFTKGERGLRVSVK